MKCIECGHYKLKGYINDSRVCELGVGEEQILDAYQTDNGCELTKKQRVLICKKLKNEIPYLWWDESEDEI